MNDAGNEPGGDLDRLARMAMRAAREGEQVSEDATRANEQVAGGTRDAIEKER